MTSVRILTPGEKLGAPSIMETTKFIARIGVYYPNILVWMRDKVKPGIDAGTRRIFWRRDPETQKLIGIGIAKKTDRERKVCTLCVDPKAVGDRLGYGLMDEMMAWLETDTPHFTVQADNLHKLHSLINHYGFSQYDAKRGLYVPSKTELLFNGEHSLPYYFE